MKIRSGCPKASNYWNVSDVGYKMLYISELCRIVF